MPDRQPDRRQQDPAPRLAPFHIQGEKNVDRIQILLPPTNVQGQDGQSLASLSSSEETSGTSYPKGAAAKEGTLFGLAPRGACQAGQWRCCD